MGFANGPALICTNEAVSTLGPLLLAGFRLVFLLPGQQQFVPGGRPCFVGIEFSHLFYFVERVLP